MYKRFQNGELYIGTNAGKRLIDDISNAKKEVLIVSPFLSPGYVNKLIDLHNKGMDITLITSDEIEDYDDESQKEQITTKLIKQIRHTDEEKEKIRSKGMKLYYTLRNTSILLFGLNILGLIFFKIPILFLTLAIFFSISFILQIIYSKYKNIKIYTYSYKPLFKFKVFPTPENDKRNKYFIHSKIFIIDRKVLYVGSVNYTYSGIKKNYETIVRIIDSETINEVMNEIYLLYNNKDLFSLSIEELAKKVYDEPQN